VQVDRPRRQLGSFRDTLLRDFTLDIWWGLKTT
jgi:hypothetical protein